MCRSYNWCNYLTIRGFIVSMLDLIGAEAIAAKIEEGTELKDIAKEAGVAYSTLWQFMRATPEREKLFARAFELSAEALLSKGRQILNDALSKKGDIDPTAARALAQEYARLAGIRNRSFSDKPQVAVQINNGPQPLQLPDNADPIAASRTYQALITAGDK